MSNHLAIATVTATLKAIVESSARSAVSGATVTVGRPRALTTETDLKVFLYLYQVTPNAALRNSDLRTRDAEGRLATRPKAALDLHYLITFYGDSSEFQPDRMLGAVVRDLHARPLLTRSALRDAISSTSVLASSDLDRAIEHVKFTPAALSLDEFSKLWSIMVQTPHAVSVAYIGSVVQIETDDPAATSLPVLKRGEEDRGVETAVGAFPQLSSMWIGPAAAAERRPRPPSVPCGQLGTRLVISARDLGGDSVQLVFSHTPLQPRTGGSVPLPARTVEIPSSNRSAEEVVFDVPDDAAAQTEWAAGIYSVTAHVHRGDYTPPPTGALPLAFAARVVDIQPNPAIRDGNGSVTLQIKCRPRVLDAQAVVLIVGGHEVAAESFSGATDTVTFVLQHAPVLTDAVVRLRVDGVDSLPFRFNEGTGQFVFDEQQRITIR